MLNQSLVALTNSVLGSGKSTARGNYAYHCPLCNHPKPKLEINFTENEKGENPWHCWVCDKVIVKYVGNEKNITVETKLELPKEFKLLNNIHQSDITGRQAMAYIKSRGITEEDIMKYGIGYCEKGRYANMVIIPSFDAKGNLNYFTGRSFEKQPSVKYRNPQTSRDIIPFEMFINWDLPLILCEGPFDAIAIKRNVVPLLGKNIQSNLMKKIVMSSVEKIYIALDRDAQKQALNFCEQLMKEGKEVYLVDMKDKDPSEMGFANFTNLIQETYPLTFSGLLEKKLFL